LIREQAAFVDGFVATSRYYAEHCHGWLDIPADRMQVIYPGVKADDTPKDATPKPSSSASADNPFVVGYMARVCPAKGLHLLYEAVQRLRNGGRNVVLVAAGNLNPGDRPYLDEMRLSPSPGFIYRGEVNRAGKQALLQDSHVLSVPTVHREAKGLFVLEALTQGVPVVQPRHGAFPELIEATGGGLLVEPNDPEALADGIARLIDQPDLREHLGRQGRAAVLQSFTDRTMAEQTWALYQRYCGNKHA
jgi:glycosyltransferase involved in cell wall biosynthesis